MKKKHATRKIIEIHALFTVPKDQIMRFVLYADSIDGAVLDLQEEYPDGKITRASILSWKFMTVGDVQKDKELVKELSGSGVKLFAGRRRVELPNPERSVATGDAILTDDDKQKS